MAEKCGKCEQQRKAQELLLFIPGFYKISVEVLGAHKSNPYTSHSSTHGEIAGVQFQKDFSARKFIYRQFSLKQYN